MGAIPRKREECRIGVLETWSRPRRDRGGNRYSEEVRYNCLKRLSFLCKLRPSLPHTWASTDSTHNR